MSSPNNYSQTYLKKINTELNSIINYAKRFYDLNTNPCGKAGTIGKAKDSNSGFSLPRAIRLYPVKVYA